MPKAATPTATSGTAPIALTATPPKKSTTALWLASTLLKLKSRDSLPRHEYHFQVVCQNHPLGPTAGEDEHLETTEAPTINGITTANLTATTADLTAAIDPQGFDTRYHFEFGTTTNYGTDLPIPEGEITGTTKELSRSHSVEVHLEGLQPGVVYHFRLSATSQWGTTTTEDQTFNFYPPRCPNETLHQETNSSFLPDCRAYELVSPGNAGGVILAPGQVPSSSDAENPTRFAFFGVLGEIPGGESSNYNGDTYIATRTPTGWVTHYVGLRGYEHNAELGGFMSSLSLEESIDFARPEVENGQPPDKAPYAWDSEGDPLGQWPADVSSVPGGEASDGMVQPSPRLLTPRLLLQQRGLPHRRRARTANSSRTDHSARLGL